MSFLSRRHFVSISASMGAASLVPHRSLLAQDGLIEIPVVLREGRVLVSVDLDGNGPYPFVFDTGGTVGLIDMKLVQALKLRRVGLSRLALSVGTRNYPVYEVKDLVFGGQVRQASAVFAGIEGFAFGRGVRGSLAAGVLSSVTGELDYEQRVWRIHRGAEPDRSGWTRYDDAIVEGGNRKGSAFLFASAAIGGRTIRLGLDTGMPTPLRLYRKAAEAAGLWDAPRWTPESPRGTGRMVRAPVVIAGSVVENVPITLLEDPQWSVFPDGIIGLPVMQMFNMATHAGDRALYLRRNGLPAPRRFDRYNRAGLWVDRAEGGVSVAVVGAGSPAEKAGIRPGDMFVGADFSKLISHFQDEPGSEIPLTVKNAEGTRDLALVLEDFL